MEFKKGDLVKLKSGGPTMTVSEIENNRIYCQWFANNELKTEVIEAEALVKVS